MNKLVFSSDDLPHEIDDKARFAAWRDIYLGTICHFDVERLTDPPFSIRYEFVKAGDVAISRCNGTVHRISRTTHHVAADPSDDFFVSFNGPRPWGVQMRGRQHAYAAHSGVFLYSGEPARADHVGGSSWEGVVLPCSRVRELVPHWGDLVGQTFDRDSEVARHLKRYVDMLLTAELGFDSALATHVETTLLDLMALLLEGRRDAVELAGARGLRAARLQGVLTAIRKEFMQPTFSVGAVAARLGLTPNYIQKLLHESGASFTERVLELRLQKARAMLADPAQDATRVSDIALACGFNEVSYFNRCFRRRFGAAPNDFRRGGG
jgi:AraC-like DNA-binding protein